jgi:hypothetical protein
VKIPDQNIIVSGLDAARQKAAINIFSDNRGNRFTVSVADNILFTPKKITTAPLIIPIAFFNFGVCPIVLQHQVWPEQFLYHQ